MKDKIFKSFLVIILIFTLTGLDLIFLGNQAILALYEGLEEQSSATNIENIEFDAYFKEGENKIHSKQSSINQGENLILDLAVKKVGVLEEGKIKIENANFTIDKAKVKDENIKEIHEETNEIELNQMASGNVTIILPIKFEKQKANTLNYFDQESQIKLTGKYKQSDINTKEVNSQIATRVRWTEDVDINLTQEIEKYLDLGTEGILLQQKVTLDATNNALPVERQAIKVAIPELEGKVPSRVVVLHNGNQLEESKYQLDSNHKMIEIKQEQDSKNIQWGTGVEEYKIIYTYDQEIGYKQRMINLKTTATAKLYTKEDITKTDSQQVEIDKKGNIISLNKEVTPSIYKGYMYANTNNQVNYQDKLSVEFSNIDVVGDVVTLAESNSLVNAKNEKFNINNSIIYRTIQINKKNMLDILGQEGSIQIQKEDGTILNTINRNTEEDENGNIIYAINDAISNLQIVTTKPEKEGCLDIDITKSISGQTGYAKENLKSFVALEEITTVGTNKVEPVTTLKNIELKEPITEAELNINNNKLSTLEKNQNVQLTITLKSDDAKYNLWKNPYLYLKLPEEIEEIKVNSIEVLYGDNLVIEKANLIENGKAIEIQMNGEQLEFQNNMNEGIQIVINADITLAKMTPSKLSTIELLYRNANSENIEQKTELGININSKFGALLYNKLEGYNNENEKLETISQETITGELDTQAEAKESKAHVEIVNNYEEAMNQVNTIIDLPNTENTGKEKSTINVQLAKAMQVEKENVEIYYATKDIEQDSKEWIKEVPNLADVKKIKLVAKELQPGESVAIDYTIQIPEDIEEEQVAYQETTLNYEYQDQQFSTYSGLRLVSPEGANSKITTSNSNGVKVNVKASTKGKEIKSGDTVQEGQTIRYNIDITNNTGKDLNNFSVEGLQTDTEGNSNVTFFNMKEAEEYQPATGENVIVKRYREDDTLETIKLQQEKIGAGETVEFQYEFTINKIEKENEITKGTLVIKADGIEDITTPLMENKIENAELKVITSYGRNEEVAFVANIENLFTYTVENLTNNKLENIELNITLPEGTQLNSNYQESTELYDFIEYANRVVKLKINQLEGNQKLEIPLLITVNEIDSNKLEEQYSFFCEATVNNQTYYSNQIEKTAKQDVAKLEISQQADRAEKFVKEGDNITYTTTITNQSLLDADLTIEDNLAEILEIQEAYIEKNGQKVKDMEISKEEEGTLITTDYHLLKGEALQVVIKVQVGQNDDEISEFSHYLEIYNATQSSQSNVITYQLKEETGGNNGGGEIEEPDGPESTNGVIRGKAWLDANKDGMKEDTGIANMEVMLINSETGDIVANTTTNAEGEYTFQSLKSDRYLVGFKYDTNQYTVTKYKVAGTNEDSNSDVISRELNIGGKTITLAVTDEIDMKGNTVDHIDAGFYENEIFDLSLQKGIRKVITQSTRGTRLQEYNDTDLAKVELHSKEVQGANVLIEYVIKITNEGEIPGFVNDVIDYIPQELTFSSEINKDWYITNGKLHNQSLTNEIIKPGETKELTLTLTKTMSSDTTGTIRNTAEIGTSTNDLGKTDYDSTPGNKQQNEDDISSADVIVSISTGAMTIIITTIVVMLGLVLISVIIYQLRKVTANHKEV